MLVPHLRSSPRFWHRYTSESDVIQRVLNADRSVYRTYVTMSELLMKDRTVISCRCRVTERVRGSASRLVARDNREESQLTVGPSQHLLLMRSITGVSYNTTSNGHAFWRRCRYARPASWRRRKTVIISDNSQRPASQKSRPFVCGPSAQLPDDALR